MYILKMAVEEGRGREDERDRRRDGRGGSNVTCGREEERDRGDTWEGVREGREDRLKIGEGLSLYATTITILLVILVPPTRWIGMTLRAC